MAALQLAQQAGAEVFATASPGKWDALKSLGIKHIMNSRTLDFADEIMAITQGEGVDIVFNSLSGEFIPKSLSVLSDQGRFIEIGKREVWTTEQVQRIKPDVAYFLVDLMAVAQQQPHLVQSMLTYLMGQFQEDKLHPLPQKVFPLQDTLSAFRTMQQAKHIGKIVVSLEDREKEDKETKRQSSVQPLTFIRKDSTYLITGGLGGLGLLVARWLVERGARNLVLVGRSGINSTTQKRIQELEQLGAKIVVAQADVSQREQLAQVLGEIEQSLPPLRGVIHAAGILDDGVLRQLDWERLERVMAPKVEGAWNLHLLTQDKPLDFFILFSSAASLLGSPGQGNHVAANTFLDTLAHYRQKLGLPGLSINWGAWSEIGAAAKRQVDEQMSLKGVGAIAPHQGLQILEALMQEPSAQVGAIPVNWSQLLEKGIASPFFTDFYRVSEQQPKRPSALLQQLKQKRASDRQAFLVAHLQGEVGKVLGLQLSQLPNPGQGFFDIGMDSLMAIELRNRLEISLGVSVSSTVIFEYPTIKDLARYIAEEVLPSALPEARTAKEVQPSPVDTSKEEVEVSIVKELEELEALLGGGEQP
jgi:NADPH:quinone reductase-like Zn-dependent oxidoreductase/acyl carrier protein